MTEEDQTRTRIEAVWRIESTRLIATLSRMVRDIGLAEELAQDALVLALEKWPHTGVPDNPGAWLTTAAKNRAIDRFRRDERLADRTAQLARRLGTVTVDEFAEANEDIGDDLLRLIFTACHPVLATPAKVALTLRVVGGLTTGEIARAFMVPESTVAQRIVRAKRTLAKAEVPFEIPQAEEIPARLSSVLEVLYLIFNEGYSATAGDDLLRPELCHDAIRMARILVQVAPGYAEAHGLSALLELQGSRFSARVTSTGEPVLLADQDRTKWDRLLIRRGLTALAKAESLSDDPGVYTLQAAIAACHARAVTVADTDWRGIAAIYDRLVAVSPSPVVELNRAVAVSRAYGPQVGLDIVDALAQTELMSSYHLLPAVRGDLLARLDRAEEARDAFLLAAGLTDNQVEQRLLRARADAVSG
ncbi:RNA polymerase ECF family sigma subunit [Stackebrandtia endophytica]|uniref:RNA polymerase ECF family sigma subunit n=1 Tax=Stackebrandtia endophytica TaxID=1496996 RepID=A0A543B411_9ACTN|nr:RNA polymerase sigma factor [Stackebrandtia endophytica]TQL79574.1 RNA polymerase ECF family sigma subunit [Stackebrandtia endophytica]